MALKSTICSIVHHARRPQVYYPTIVLSLHSLEGRVLRPVLQQNLGNQSVSDKSLNLKTMVR